MKKNKRVIFCGLDKVGCPTLFVKNNSPVEKQILITDDFGQKIEMSKEQWYTIEKMVREGKTNI